MSSNGFRGVIKNGAGRFCAKTQVKKKVHRLGTFDTAKAAAIAYDRAISDFGLPKEKLNFPNGFPKDDPDYAKIMNDDGTLKKRSKRGPKPAKTAGVGGKRKKRYTAKIGIEKKRIALGTYDTQKEAKLAYDAAVLSNNLSKDRLNYPNGLPKDDPDYERLKDFKPKVMGPSKVMGPFTDKKHSSASTTTTTTNKSETAATVASSGTNTCTRIIGIDAFVMLPFQRSNELSLDEQKKTRSYFHKMVGTDDWQDEEEAKKE
jgi:hypothetical protein